MNLIIIVFLIILILFYYKIHVSKETFTYTDSIPNGISTYQYPVPWNRTFNGTLIRRVNSKNNNYNDGLLDYRTWYNDVWNTPLDFYTYD
jgi:hypothetical protein